MPHADGLEAAGCTVARRRDVVIPSMIVVGLVLGRWWRAALLAAAIGWPLLLVATGVMNLGFGVVAASALAVCNAAVGVLAHQGALHAYRHSRHHKGPGEA